MITDALLSFVRAQHEARMDVKEIVRLLTVQGGWEKTDVEEAFRALGMDTAAGLSLQKTSVPTLAPEGVTIQGQAVKPETSFPEPKAREVESQVMEILARPLQTVIKQSEPITQSPPQPVDPKVQDDFLGMFRGQTVNITKAPAPTFPKTSQTNETAAPEVSLEELLKHVSAPLSTSGSPEKQPAASAASGGIKLNLSALNNPVTVKTEAPARMPPAESESQAHASVISGAQAKDQSTDTPTARPVQGVQKTQAQDVTGSSPIPAHRTMQADLLKQSASIGELHETEAETGVSAKAASVFTPAISTVALNETKSPESPAPQPTAQAKMPPPVDLPHDTSSDRFPNPFYSTSSPASISTTKYAAAMQTKTSETAQKKSTRHALSLVIGVFLLLASLGSALWAFVSLRGPDENALVAASINKFFALSSFSYEGEGNVDLTLVARDQGGRENKGVVRFLTGYQGSLEIGSEGYGNGDHRVRFEGGLSTGNFTWSTDVEADVRIIGKELYFHIFALPDVVTTKELFNSHWINIDLSEIAKELALSGVAIAQEGYGAFGGLQSEYVFNNALARHMPFSPHKLLSSEELNGAPAYRIALKSDPQQAIEFVRVLYKKYTNKDFVISEEERVRLVDALEKIEAEIWIDEMTEMPVKFLVKGDVDDEIFGVRTKGPFEFTFILSNFNQPVSAPVPTPVLTVDELKFKMEEVKKRQEARARDTVKIDKMSEIIAALKSHQSEKGRFPQLLSALHLSKVLATSTVSEAELKEYIYAPYIKPGVTTKAGRCTQNGAICGHYHLGVSLEDIENPALKDDVDLLSDVWGEDGLGCVKEMERACFDTIRPLPSPPPLNPQAATSTASTPAQL